MTLHAFNYSHSYFELLRLHRRVASSIAASFQLHIEYLDMLFIIVGTKYFKINFYFEL